MQLCQETSGSPAGNPEAGTEPCPRRDRQGRPRLPPDFETSTDQPV